LSETQAACLDFKALAAFWQSDVGRQLIAHSGQVRREVAFTARFAPSELENLRGNPSHPLPRERERVAKPGEGAPARVLSSQSSIQCGSPDSSEPLNQGRDGPATLANPQSAICNPQSSDGSIPTGRDPAVPSSSGAGGEEFVIVQGVIDLAVVMPEEIWVLDFKTDHFAGADLEAKIRIYRPQLSLYAQAIARIYGRPVTRRWLHFFALSRTIQLDSTN
jgi:hypothetical protein